MNKRFKSIFALLITITMLVTCLISFGSTSTASATENNVYVAITGNDTTGNGTIESPYRTLYVASRKLTQGASLIIGGGVYGFDDCLWLTKSGTTENPITIEPAIGETVTITGAGKYGRTIYAAGVSNVIIKNINFYAVDSGVRVTGSRNLTIDGCSFVNLPNIYTMVFTDSSFCTIQNNYFDTNGGDLLGSGAGDAFSGAGCSNLLVQNNFFTKNGHYAVTFTISPGTPNVSHNNVIRQNYIDEKWGGGIGLILGTEKTVIEDNLVKNAGEQCISYPKGAVQVAASTTILRNNLLLTSKHGRVEYQSKEAFDGDLTTYWEAPYSSSAQAANEKHWLAVDLGSNQTVDKVIINWGEDYSTRTDGIITNYPYYKSYEIQTSLNGLDWDTLATNTNGIGGTSNIAFTATNARYVRMNGLAMPMSGANKTTNGCRITEFQVYNTAVSDDNLAANKVSVASSTTGAYDGGVGLYSYEYNGYPQNCTDNRVYNNVIYGNGGAAVGFSQRNVTYDTRNKVVNNIMYKNRANGLFNYWGNPGYYTISVEATGTSIKWDSYPNENSIYNNIILHADNIAQYPGYDKLFNFDYANWTKSLTQVQSDYPGFIYGNKEENPLFANEYAEDFSLSSNSPAIDAGANLAKTSATASEPTIQVPVDDSLFFSDGYGVVPGDLVIVGQNTPTRITDVDYLTNTLTLESPISYVINDSVNLPYKGSAPDMGAIEYSSSSSIPTAPVSAPPVNTLEPTPTPTVSPVATPTPTHDPNQGSMKAYDFAVKNQGDGLFKYTLTNGPLKNYLGVDTDLWTVWKANNIFSDRGAPESTLTYKFQGTKVRLFAEVSPYCGFAGITILDEIGNVYLPEELIDCYNDSNMGAPIIYTSPELPYGIYSIHIRNTAIVNENCPFMQFNQELQQMTPIGWTLNFMKIEVFNSTATAPPTATPKITPTPKPTATATPTVTPVPAFTPTPTPFPTSSPAFSDVGPDLAEGWACEYIQSLASMGIINGYSDGTFKPENYITRSEFIKVLTVAFGLYNANAVIDTFSDVNPNDWFYAYVASGVNAGLASPGGMGDGTFGSEAFMSREQMVTFSSRALIQYKGYTYPDESVTVGILAIFNDADTISEYARTSVALCVDQGILNGYNENDLTLFKPANNINRAEVAKVTDMVVKLEWIWPPD